MSLHSIYALLENLNGSTASPVLTAPKERYIVFLAMLWSYNFNPAPSIVHTICFHIQRPW
jgi:hypothetical protein